MSVDLSTSVAQITSSDSAVTQWGTGFVFYQDSDAMYWVTCAHVVRDVGGEGRVLIDGLPAEVLACGEPSFTDVAVLKAPLMTGKQPLRLQITGQEGDTFEMSGWGAFNHVRKLQPLSGRVGDAIQLAPPGQEKRVHGWNLVIHGDHGLEGGYSGSPIMHQSTGSVIAVTSHMQDKGSRGTAISIITLQQLWDDSIHLQQAFPQQVWDSLLYQPIVWSETTHLKQILSGSDLNDDQVSALFSRVVPAGTPFPGQGQVPDALGVVIDSLARKACVPLFGSPLIEFALLCQDTVSNLALRNKLDRWCLSVTQRMGVDLQGIRDHIAARAPLAQQQPVLMIKVERALPSFTNFLVKAWLFPCADSQDCVGLGIFEEVPYDLLPETIGQALVSGRRRLSDPSVELTVECILPLDLLNCDVDQWKINVGKRAHPIGTRYALVLRSLERIYNDEYVETWVDWHKSWNRRPCRADCITDAHVHWTTGEAEQNGQLYDRLQQVCLLLALTIKPASGAGGDVSDTLSTALDAGTSIALWLRDVPGDPAEGREQLRRLVYDGPLDTLAGRIKTWRAQQFQGGRGEGPGGPVASPTYASGSLSGHISLLWDDPGRLPPDTQFWLKAPE